jgi:hypothetical protein
VFQGNGQLMGSEIQNTREKVFRIEVQGENSLKAVELIRCGELHTRLIPQGIFFSEEITVNDEEPSNWYLRVTQQDNHVAVSSPVFYT